MSVPDRKLEYSRLGGLVTRAGVSIDVKIYRFAGTNEEWTLEIIDKEDRCTIFNETFESEIDAFEAFEAAIDQYGIGSFSENDESSH